MKIIPDSLGEPEGVYQELTEAWSDAARAAAAASRKHRGEGLSKRRQAAYRGFFGSGSLLPQGPLTRSSSLRTAFDLGWDDRIIGQRSRVRSFKKPSHKVAYKVGFTKTSGPRSLAVNAGSVRGKRVNRKSPRQYEFDRIRKGRPAAWADPIRWR